MALDLAVRACELSHWEDWDCSEDVGGSSMRTGPARRGGEVGDPGSHPGAGSKSGVLPLLAGALSSWKACS